MSWKPFHDMADPYPGATFAFNEFEALAMGEPPHRIKTIKRAVPKPDEDLIKEDSNPLVEIFQADGIRILGTAKRPTFCAKDVAAYIGDANYVRTLRSYGADATEETGTYICTIATHDTSGRPCNMLYLTENGLYRYLLRSDLPKATKFQSYAYGILRSERERVVDSVMLALKIEKTAKENLQKQLERSTREYCMVRSDLDSTMRAANDAREQFKTANTQLKRLQTQQRNKVDERIAAAEEANRTRSWMGTYRPVD